MSKIMFIWPPITSKERYGAIGGGGTYMPPIGIGILAAITRREGYETRILDCETLQLSQEQAVQNILDFAPDFIGISATTLSIFSAAKLAKEIKKKQNNIKIIVGGPHITAVPEHTLNLFPEIDVAVIGEGEITIVELLRGMDQETDLSKIEGLVYRKNNSLINTGRRKYIENLDEEVPFPAWDLFPDLTTTYRPPVFSFNRLPAISIITTRGCPAVCTFCDRSVFGKVCRAHSSEYIFNMIKYLNETYGFKDIMIYDDTFVAFRKLLVGLCEKLIESDLDIRWSCNGRVDMVNPEILDMMRRAGCWQIAYGIESGNQEILQLMGKNIKLDVVEQAVRWTRQAGIKSKGYFILGFPKETEKTINETIRFMLKIPLDDIHVTLFTPFPNTEAYHLSKKYGQLEDDWSKMNQWNPVFVPHGFVSQDLEKYLKVAVRKFYLRVRIIFSYVKMIRRPEHLKNILRGLFAFIKLMVLRQEKEN